MSKKFFRALILLICLTLVAPFLNATKTFAATEPQIMGQSAITMDLDTGEIIYSKNADEQRSPASTTKLLTAVVAIENCNLDREIEVKQAALNKVDVESSIVGLRAGSTYTMEQLLYMLLIVSAGDAAEVIAE